MSPFLSDTMYIEVATPNACATLCLNENAFRCVSTMYDLLLGDCFLSSHPLVAMGTMVDDAGYGLTMRDCEPMTSPTEMTQCYLTQCPHGGTACVDGVCKCEPGWKYDSNAAACTDSKYVVNLVMAHTNILYSIQ